MLARLRAPERIGRALALGALLVALAAGAAVAGRCGDDVDGRDVPCGCGDVLVSGVVLADDPIADSVCQDDGLIVRIENPARSALVDLRGRSLRGSGRGAALRVLAGGAGGARLVSSGAPARLSGFEDGVVARGPDAIAALADVLIERPSRDGLRLSGANFEVRRVEVRDAGRDAFVLNGRGFLIAGTRALGSRRFGYSVMGDSGTIGLPDAAVIADGSGQAGFNVMGAGHVLENCTANDGRKDGLHLQAAHLAVQDCTARDNGGGGIVGVGSTWRMAGNRALRNGGDGIAVRGARIEDAGGNHGEANGDGLSRPPVQCAVNHVPCAM
jgi:hypothetical protein